MIIKMDRPVLLVSLIHIFCPKSCFLPAWGSLYLYQFYFCGITHYGLKVSYHICMYMVCIHLCLERI